MVVYLVSDRSDVLWQLLDLVLKLLLDFLDDLYLIVLCDLVKLLKLHYHDERVGILFLLR